MSLLWSLPRSSDSRHNSHSCEPVSSLWCYQLHGPGMPGPFPLSSCVRAGCSTALDPTPDPRSWAVVPAVSSDPVAVGFCCHEEMAPDPPLHVSHPLPLGVQVLMGVLGGQPARRSPRDGMKLAFPGALGERGSDASPSRAVAQAPPCSFSRVPSGAGRCPAVGASFRLRSGAGLGAGASPRRHSPSFPLGAPCLWPWQATGSAKDESRSLVSPLAAIAVKLEQRPANKAPPPLAPLPAARSSAFHSSAHRGICPFTLVICMIKAVLLPFLQPALKRRGSWSKREGEPARSGHPAPSPPPPAEPPRVLRRREEEEEEEEGSPQPQVLLSSFVLISGSVHSLRSSQRRIFWHGNVPSGIY